MASDAVMNRKLTLFIVTVLVDICLINCKIFTQKNDENYELVKFHSGLGDHDAHRERRSATRSHREERGVDDAKQLNVTISHLRGPFHTEAIVHWSGSDSNCIFVLTRQPVFPPGVIASTLWRSTDYGSTFQEVKLAADVVINMFYTSRSNYSKIVFTDVKNKMLYITEDEAESALTPVKLAFDPDILLFHPSEEDWLLGYSYSSSTLYVSRDLGRQWSTVHERVSSRRFFWAVPYQDVDTSVIHMEVQDENTGVYQYMKSAHPYMSHETVNEHLGNIDPSSLLVQDSYIFAQKTTDGNSYLYVSYNRAPFKLAHFPADVHPKNFLLVNSNENQVFLAVDHTETYVHLYLSDKEGLMFTRTIDNVVAVKQRDGSFAVDLYQVKGINGTYICNHFVNSSPVTKITFNKGGDWNHITAQKKECKSTQDCYLNLRLLISSRHTYVRRNILSEENAPGLIIAEGSEGAHLTEKNISRYISRDGGNTWNKIPGFTSNHRISIVDHGGAMVAVPVFKPNQYSLQYSCTEGMKWQELNFTDTPLTVNGLVGEPGITTLVISIYGHVNRTSGWEIIKLDFASILKRKCAKEDYEKWIPTDKLTPDCILGEKRIYERRKPLSECYNGRKYARMISSTKCSCSEEDFECDFGYEKIAAGCNKASWFNPNIPVVFCPENYYYNKTKGYRKVASDVCEDSAVSEQYAPVHTPCPVIAPGSLQIHTVSSLIVRTGKLVTFTLQQDLGSKISTKYTWQSSNGSPYSQTGFEKARKHGYTYNTAGIYTVSVIAENNAGKASTSVTVKVEDEIDGIKVTVPHGAAVGKPVSFSVQLVTDAGHIHRTSGNVHYVWNFGDGSKPLLTWESQVNHTYTKFGNYSPSVTASNAISSHFRSFVMPVYSYLVTVQLSFTHNVDVSYYWRGIWHTAFTFKLKKRIAEVLAISESRLEVAVLSQLPVHADVSILPLKQDVTSDPTVDQFAVSLIKAVRQKLISITLEGYMVVNATSARIVTYEVPEGPPSNAAVYISIPILFVACLMVLLICLYYKKKLNQANRYSVVRTEPGDDADHLLDGDEDDDQLLDISSGAHIQSPAEESAAEPTLVFMSGQGSQESQAVINC